MLENYPMSKKFTSLAGLYIEIENLKRDYRESLLDRKTIISDIARILEYIGRIDPSLKEKYRAIINNLFYDIRRFKEPDFLYELILYLANKEKEEYALKTIWATNVYLNETNVSCARTYGIIYVLGKKNIIDKIDDKKIYFRTNFSNTFNSILKCKSTFLLSTKDGDGIYFKSGSKDAFMLSFPLDGYYSDVVGFLFDDELAKIIKKVYDFTLEYGCDFSEYSVNEVSKIISEYTPKEKVYKKE